MRGGLGGGYEDVDCIWNYYIVIMICNLGFYNKLQNILKLFFSLKLIQQCETKNDCVTMPTLMYHEVSNTSYFVLISSAHFKFKYYVRGMDEE